MTGNDLEAMRGYQIEAQALAGEHIGKRIRFVHRDGSTDYRQTETIVTAELRQISHNSGETHLTYGYGAEAEASFHPEDVITLYPRSDYDDVEDLTKVNALRRAARSKL